MTSDHPPSNAMVAYWQEHFARQHADSALGDAKKLDFSNDRVRFQTYGWILEAMGPVTDKRCLDAGCGTGKLAQLIGALGARVEAFDLAEPAVRRLQKERPQIRWFVADVMQLDATLAGGSFDVVVASEVLQYVDVASAVRTLWNRVAPGGRLVAVVPNARCPIVQRARERHAGHYNGISADALAAVVAGLEGVAFFRWRGATFASDQRMAPYDLGPWTDGTAGADDAFPPNRWQLVVLREG